MPDRKDKEIEVEEAHDEKKAVPIEKEDDERKENSTVRSPSPIKAYVPPIPFPQWL